MRWVRERESKENFPGLIVSTMAIDKSNPVWNFQHSEVLAATKNFVFHYWVNFHPRFDVKGVFLIISQSYTERERESSWESNDREKMNQEGRKFYVWKKIARALGTGCMCVKLLLNNQFIFHFTTKTNNKKGEFSISLHSPRSHMVHIF